LRRGPGEHLASCTLSDRNHAPGLPVTLTHWDPGSAAARNTPARERAHLHAPSTPLAEKKKWISPPEARAHPGRHNAIGVEALQARSADCGRRTRLPNTCVRAPSIPRVPSFQLFVHLQHVETLTFSQKFQLALLHNLVAVDLITTASGVVWCSKFDYCKTFGVDWCSLVAKREEYVLRFVPDQKRTVRRELT